ncbi:hypothetical protein F5X68DRAFT_230741 [Plectosphaerella plurivora]|uniref:Zn(2)-C6 fungal-type domain-containing protein n=1 Tax=Plectosphaerella plurivora TaxID=936078 RepID=A0A9P8VEC5_9PEZI|nr:hypothetical protein F5X68DRAFT_230741 [Plectosphaerella plurivora]
MQPESQAYQPIPGHVSDDFTIDKPYTGEKRPSAQMDVPGDYMSASVTFSQPSSYVMDSGLVMGFVPNFQDMHMATPVSPVAVRQDGGFFSGAPSASLYPMAGMTDNMSMPMLGFDGGFAPVTDASDRKPLLSYGSVTTAAETSAPAQLTAPLAGAQPCFDLVKTEQEVASYDLDRKTSPAVILLQSNQKAPASKRGPFVSKKARDETAATRKRGSCIRCRMQRIRCIANAECGPDGVDGPCLTCSKQRPNPKTWRLPCFRSKITDVKLFKPGNVQGKEWTLRWKDDVLDNSITTWAESTDRKIMVSEGFTREGITLRVKRFKPQPGDKLIREWASTDARRTKREVELPPYAVVDVDEAKTEYEKYIMKSVRDYKGFMAFLDAVIGTGSVPYGDEAHAHVRETYHFAWSQSRDPNIPEAERNLLTRALHLWVAIRLTTSSTTIIGQETLGIKEMPTDSPQHGKRPLPPVMGAQIDNILRVSIQAQWRQKLLELLQKMVQENKQATWFTTYLITFILLHNAALLMAHDHKYAKKHNLQRRWAREVQVEHYMQGANTLLSYFHYCNKGMFPFTEACREQDLRGLAELDQNRMEYVRRTKQWAVAQRQNWADIHQNEQFEHDYFWVSQLYTHNWVRLAG